MKVISLLFISVFVTMWIVALLQIVGVTNFDFRMGAGGWIGP